MSDLTKMEKKKLERILGMASGYVLDFSNRTFEEFVYDSTGKEIYDEKYNINSGSKANRMRAFWEIESNYLVRAIASILKSVKPFAYEDFPVLETYGQVWGAIKISALRTSKQLFTVTPTSKNDFSSTFN